MRTASRAPTDRVADGTTSALLRAQAWPAISVLVTTTPAPVLHRRDAARVAALLRDVKGTLGRLPGVDAEAVGRRLRRLVERASRLPAQRGFAMFVGGPIDEVVTLPIPVRTRAVVDRTFHVRDLLHAAQHTQGNQFLVVEPHSARLYDDQQGSLAECHGRFPIAGPAIVGTEMFRRQVVAAVQDDVHDASPFTVATADPEVIPARELAHLTVLAGVVVLPPNSRDLSALDALCRARVEEWRQASLTEAVVSATSGAAWQHGLRRVSETVDGAPRGELVVEVGFHYPAGGHVRIGRGRRSESLSGRADAVEDVIAMVARAGGEVVFVADGALATVGRIAYQPAGRESDPMAKLLARRAASAYPGLQSGPTSLTPRRSAPRMPLRPRDRPVIHACPGRARDGEVSRGT